MALARSLAVLALVALAACAEKDLDPTPEPIGDFRLGHDIVLARETTKGPFSREATPKELTEALQGAIDRRLTRYDGDGLYHLGVSIGAYVLAQPGVPVVYTPKSVMIFDVTIYDNSTGEKVNEEPKRFTAFEGLENTAPLIGSGIARGKDEQLANLVEQGARSVEAWLRENEEWFTPEPDKPRVPYDREAQKSKVEDATSGLNSDQPVDMEPAVEEPGQGAPQ